MTAASPGEIWMVDLGLAAKVRPCLLLSDYPADDELALILVVPHTTAVRGNRWEFAAPPPFMKPGVFHLQQIQPVSLVRPGTKARRHVVTQVDRIAQRHRRVTVPVLSSKAARSRTRRHPKAIENGVGTLSVGNMGLGFVLVIWAVVGTILAGIGLIVFGGATSFFTRGVPNGRRKAIAVAGLFPFACLAWAAANFVFQAVVNEGFLHRDPGLGGHMALPTADGLSDHDD